MFIAALFTIAKLWKQPKYPLIDEWIKKIWYTHTQWNITQPSKGVSCHLQRTWMELEGIMLSKINQSEKDKYHYDLMHMWNLRNKTDGHLGRVKRRKERGKQAISDS